MVFKQMEPLLYFAVYVGCFPLYIADLRYVRRAYTVSKGVENGSFLIGGVRHCGAQATMKRENGRDKTRQHMRLIGYARVSREDQNLHLQIDALRAAECKAIYRDNGVSGIAARRLGLAKALKALRHGDVLVTWKLDRLGRSLAELIAIMAELERRGVGFRSLSGSIDTTTPGGRLVFHVMGALAEFERGLVSERTKAGMVAAKARGVTLGRPPKLTAVQIEGARRSIESNTATAKDLADSLGVTPLTLARALKRREGDC